MTVGPWEKDAAIPGQDSVGHLKEENKEADSSRASSKCPPEHHLDSDLRICPAEDLVKPLQILTYNTVRY